MITVDQKEKPEYLGRRLREARLAENEAQERFASRIGISVPTLRKMEKGDPSCSIGLWVEALHILDPLNDIDMILKKQQSLFDKRDEMKTIKRRRASKRKKVD